MYFGMLGGKEEGVSPNLSTDISSPATQPADLSLALVKVRHSNRASLHLSYVLIFFSPAFPF